LAIDFTASNKDADDPKSLHYFNGNVDNLNPYQDAIMSVGEILLNYDADKMVPVYGFGGKCRYPNLNSNYVNHCFNLTGDPNVEEVYGIEGIFETYNYALQNVVLSGPTHFSETFRKVVNDTKQSFIEDPYNYCFFMIITDGIIHDMQKTIDLLVEASSLPMSIVIVGVGNEDFSKMRQLDDADVIDSFGRKPKRDIVRFVEHNKFKHNRIALSKETLEEIPEQVTSFYASINKKPMPPQKVNLSQCDNLSNFSLDDIEKFRNNNQAKPLYPPVLPGNQINQQHMQSNLLSDRNNMQPYKAPLQRFPTDNFGQPNNNNLQGGMNPPIQSVNVGGDYNNASAQDQAMFQQWLATQKNVNNTNYPQMK